MDVWMDGVEEVRKDWMERRRKQDERRQRKAYRRGRQLIGKRGRPETKEEDKRGRGPVGQSSWIVDRDIQPSG